MQGESAFVSMLLKSLMLSCGMDVFRSVSSIKFHCFHRNVAFYIFLNSTFPECQTQNKTLLTTLSGLTKTPVKAAREPAMLTGNAGDPRDEHTSCGGFWMEAQLLPFILADRYMPRTSQVQHRAPVLLG